MNKELIRKYKAEFDHWLDEGKLQVKFVNDPWEEAPKDIFSYSTVNFVLVIDDAYVEFRKALAEGKNIQYKDREGFWNKIEYKLEEYHLEELRIKPEEPKFKVGDWVIHKRKGICKIEKISPTNEPDDKNVWLENKGACFINELELWEPKEEEYFWYKNDLVKFDEIKTNFGTLLESVRGCSYHTAEENFRNYCEPFIGQLPTYLKE